MNTPQNSAQLPAMNRGVAELSGASMLPPHLTSRVDPADSVPPTPYNTPQRSLELPAAVRERLSYSPTKKMTGLTPKDGPS